MSSALPPLALANHEIAKDELALYLNAGSLALFLGAGVSISLGLPGWYALLVGCAEDVGLDASLVPPPDAGAEAIQAAGDAAVKKAGGIEAFSEIVRKRLYGGQTLSGEMIRNPLMIALGALTMGSRRGKVTTIITYNYDSMLEWYLRLHGYCAHVVTELPTLMGSHDVRVFHPHGYLPHLDLGGDDGSELIFGLDSVDRRTGDIANQWNALTRSVLSSHVSLFVGMSQATFRDRAFGPLLLSVHEWVTPRPVGFWCLLPPEPPQTEAQLEARRTEFADRGVVPLEFPNSEEIPFFLLKVCEKSAQNI